MRRFAVGLGALLCARGVAASRSNATAPPLREQEWRLEAAASAQQDSGVGKILIETSRVVNLLTEKASTNISQGLGLLQQLSSIRHDTAQALRGHPVELGREDAMLHRAMRLVANRMRGSALVQEAEMDRKVPRFRHALRGKVGVRRHGPSVLDPRAARNASETASGTMDEDAEGPALHTEIDDFIRQARLMDKASEPQEPQTLGPPAARAPTPRAGSAVASDDAEVVGLASDTEDAEPLESATASRTSDSADEVAAAKAPADRAQEATEEEPEEDGNRAKLAKMRKLMLNRLRYAAGKARAAKKDEHVLEDLAAVDEEVQDALKHGDLQDREAKEMVDKFISQAGVVMGKLTALHKHEVEDTKREIQAVASRARSISESTDDDDAPNADTQA